MAARGTLRPGNLAAIERGRRDKWLRRLGYDGGLLTWASSPFVMFTAASMLGQLPKEFAA